MPSAKLNLDTNSTLQDCGVNSNMVETYHEIEDIITPKLQMKHCIQYNNQITSLHHHLQPKQGSQMSKCQNQQKRNPIYKATVRMINTYSALSIIINNKQHNIVSSIRSMNLVKWNVIFISLHPLRQVACLQVNLQLVMVYRSTQLYQSPTSYLQKPANQIHLKNYA